MRIYRNLVLVTVTCMSVLTLPTLAGAAPNTISSADANLPGSVSFGSFSALAGVSPLTSGNTCNLSNDLNNVTCFQISGTGTYVSRMYATTNVNAFAIYGHIEISGPNGFFRNTPDANITPSFGIYLNLANLGTMPSGTYCASTWWNLGGGVYDLYSSACNSVHA